MPKFLRERRAPTVQDDQLERAALATVEDYVAVPDCEIVVDELDAAIDAWLDDEAPNARVLLVVLAPCETRGLMERTARRRGFEVLEEPGRDALVEPAGAPGAGIFDAGADAVLAIPRLERWFVRHRHGLGLVRALLGEIAADRAALPRRRQQLGLALRGEGRAGGPGAAAAGDAARVRRAAPARVARRARPRRRHRRRSPCARSATARTCWRSPATDRSATTSCASSPPAASASRGCAGSCGAGACARCPWTTRRRRPATIRPPGGTDPHTDSARIDEAVPARRRAADDDHTMWITHDAPLLLPAGHEHDAALVLQALLIHAFLAPAELERTVPLVGESGIVRALERAGFVERCEGGFRCRPAAYPSIRAALGDAGYPLPPV